MLKLEFKDGRTVESSITDLIGKVGENVVLRRTKVVKAPQGGIVASYIHNEVDDILGAIGCLVSLKSTKSDTMSEEQKEFAIQIAMHIAAMAPQYLTRNDIPQEVLEKEKSVQMELAKQSGKPESVLAKMVEGKLNKIFERITLMEQPWMLDEKKKVKDVLKENGIEVVEFVRYKCGEQ